MYCVKQIYIFSNITCQVNVIMDQEVGKGCEYSLAWKSCMESSLYFWCCQTSHQHTQDGYPKHLFFCLRTTESSGCA